MCEYVNMGDVFRKLSFTGNGHFIQTKNFYLLFLHIKSLLLSLGENLLKQYKKWLPTMFQAHTLLYTSYMICKISGIFNLKGLTQQNKQ